MPWGDGRQLPRNWGAIRARVLRRDPTCMACGVRPSAEADHVADPDDHSMGNLQGLCTPCHKAKTQREAAAGRAAWRARAPRHRPVGRHPGLID